MQLQSNIGKVPRHVGIILDGNRRFAKRLMLKPWKGHEWGRDKVEKVLEWAIALGIQELTLYAFSIENFDRPKEEFDFLMKIFKEFAQDMQKGERKEKLMEQGVRVLFIGRTKMFPAEIQEQMQKLTLMTAKNDKFFLNIAMAYGGRAEIIDATKKIAEQIKKGELDVERINEEMFSKQLYIESEPDLIIRTSGEQRTSGFLLWQGSYAELFFCEKLWPEFEKQDLVKALEAFSERERRFGK